MMTEALVRELRRRLPLRTYFRWLGYRPKPQGKFFTISCPFHSDLKERFRIYDDYFECPGCGLRGDIIIVHAREQGCSYREAYEELCELVCLKNDRDPVNTPTPEPRTNKTRG